MTGAGNVAFALVHLIGVAVALAGFGFGVWRLVRPFARLAQAAPPRRGRRRHPATWSPTSSCSPSRPTARRSSSSVPMREHLLRARDRPGAVARRRAGRAGSWAAWSTARWRGTGGHAADSARGGRRPARPAGARRPRRVLLAALAAGLACYAVLLGIAAAHRQAPPRNVGLTAWLARHHLTSGFAALLGGVERHGGLRRERSRVLAVTDGGWHGRLAPQKWQTDTLLATTRCRPRTSSSSRQRRRCAGQAVVATFGQPAKTYTLRPLHDHGLAQEPAAAPRSPRPRTRRHDVTTASDPLGAIAGHGPAADLTAARSLAALAGACLGLAGLVPAARARRRAAR